MRSLMIIFVAMFLLMATPWVFDALDDAAVESVNESHSLVSENATGSGNVTLGQALYDNSVNFVTSVTSNESSDSPTAYSYNSASRVLQMTGLNTAPTNRTLAIVFDVSRTTLPTGMGTILELLHWFYIFMIVGTTVGAMYAFFRT